MITDKIIAYHVFDINSYTAQDAIYSHRYDLLAKKDHICNHPDYKCQNNLKGICYVQKCPVDVLEAKKEEKNKKTKH